MEYGIQLTKLTSNIQLQVQSLEVTTPSKEYVKSWTDWKINSFKSLTDSYKDKGKSDAP